MGTARSLTRSLASVVSAANSSQILSFHSLKRMRLSSGSANYRSPLPRPSPGQGPVAHRSDACWRWILLVALCHGISHVAVPSRRPLIGMSSSSHRSGSGTATGDSRQPQPPDMRSPEADWTTEDRNGVVQHCFLGGSERKDWPGAIACGLTRGRVLWTSHRMLGWETSSSGAELCRVSPVHLSPPTCSSFSAPVWCSLRPVQMVPTSI